MLRLPRRVLVTCLLLALAGPATMSLPVPSAGADTAPCRAQMQDSPLPSVASDLAHPSVPRPSPRPPSLSPVLPTSPVGASENATTSTTQIAAEWRHTTASSYCINDTTMEPGASSSSSTGTMIHGNSTSDQLFNTNCAATHGTAKATPSSTSTNDTVIHGESMCDQLSNINCIATPGSAMMA